jgi:uncharacterized protein
MSETIQSVAPNQTAPSERELIAPLWHTFLLVLLILGVSAISYFLTRRFVSSGRMPGEARLIIYLVTLVEEWGLAAYVFLAMRKRGVTVRKVINAGWLNARAVRRDVRIAVLVSAGFLAIEGLGSVVFRGQLATVSWVLERLAPHTVLEMLVWIVLSISAGLCEEFIFRGYLQEQCRRITGIRAAGVTIQALVFGAGHGYQGWAMMVTIFFIGLFFGGIVAWRKSLAPTMITHGAADTIGGVVSFLGHMMHRT